MKEWQFLLFANEIDDDVRILQFMPRSIWFLAEVTTFPFLELCRLIVDRDNHVGRERPHATVRLYVDDSAALHFLTRPTCDAFAFQLPKDQFTILFSRGDSLTL
jgi:hypothetical protein